MSRARPYFPLHRIKTGQYTKGGEYIKTDGVNYIGPYHVLPNGQHFSGFVPITLSEELFAVKFELLSNTAYRKNTTVKTGKYIAPQYQYPTVTDEDFSNGYINRYFVQKRNEPKHTIIEIDSKQYNSVNIINGPGINGYIWSKLKMPWYIRSEIMNDILNYNRITLMKNELVFPGISLYLDNLIELVK